MNTQPFVGFTNYTSSEDAFELLAAVPQGFPRPIMLSACLDDASINEDASQSKYNCLGAQLVQTMFLDRPNVLHLIECKFTSPETLYKKLAKATILGNKTLCGFQLSTTHTSYSAIQKFRKSFPSMRLVLKINRQDLARVGNEPIIFAAQIKTQFSGLVNDIIFDIKQDPDLEVLHLRSYAGFIKKVHEYEVGLGIGIYGAMDDHLTEAAAYLLKEFPFLSIQADCNPNHSSERIDVFAAAAYISNITRLLEANK